MKKFSKKIVYLYLKHFLCFENENQIKIISDYFLRKSLYSYLNIYVDNLT